MPVTEAASGPKPTVTDEAARQHFSGDNLDDEDYEEAGRIVH